LHRDISPGAAVVKGRRLWGVAALCVLSGSGWILTQAWPSEMAWPLAAFVHFGVIGLSGLAVPAARGGWSAVPWLRYAAAGVAGMCLFALPGATLQFAAGKVPEFTSVAAFCAVPLMTVLAANAFAARDSDASRFTGLMVPSVAGLGGALLLFPLENPGSARRWLFLGSVLGCCAVVALAGVWLHRWMLGTSVAAAVAVVGLVSAAALGAGAARTGWSDWWSVWWSVVGAKALAAEMLRCALFDLPVVWLTVWLAREVKPERLSARFFLVPVVTAAEGYAVERGPIQVRALLALGLLAAAGVMLLVREEPEELPGLRLR